MARTSRTVLTAARLSQRRPSVVRVAFRFPTMEARFPGPELRARSRHAREGRRAGIGGLRRRPDAPTRGSNPRSRTCWSSSRLRRLRRAPHPGPRPAPLAPRSEGSCRAPPAGPRFPSAPGLVPNAAPTPSRSAGSVGLESERAAHPARSAETPIRSIPNSGATRDPRRYGGNRRYGRGRCPAMTPPRP